jgi:hypothetical protein
MARNKHALMEAVMGLAAYDIVGSAGEWRVRHDGKAENVYQTKEAAFQAAVAAASLALRQGQGARNGSGSWDRPSGSKRRIGRE